jgi:hypothetical protein
MQVRATLTIETTTLVLVHRGSPRRAWCAACGMDGEMVALGDISGPSTARFAIERWLDSCRVHRIESPDGTVLICLASLLAGASQPQPGGSVTTLPASKERS